MSCGARIVLLTESAVEGWGLAATPVVVGGLLGGPPLRVLAQLLGGVLRLLLGGERSDAIDRVRQLAALHLARPRVVPPQQVLVAHDVSWSLGRPGFRGRWLRSYAAGISAPRCKV